MFRHGESQSITGAGLTRQFKQAQYLETEKFDATTLTRE